MLATNVIRLITPGARLRLVTPQVSLDGKIQNLLRVVVVAALAGVVPQSQAGLDLGLAESYAVLGGSAVTGAAGVLVNGDLGCNTPGALTDFPPGIVNGMTHRVDGSSLQAQADAQTAYHTLAGEASGQDLTGQNLGGLTLTSGVYHFDSTAQLTGTLILNAYGNSNARFDFIIGTTLGTAAGSQIVLTGGAQAANVFWALGTAATIGANTTFEGSILASSAITLGADITMDGRAIAFTAVTLGANDVITVPSVAAVPEPSTLVAGLGAVGLALAGLAARFRGSLVHLTSK